MSAFGCPPSELRVADLKSRQHSAARLMNVKIPAHVHEAIELLSKKLDASKTDVVLALLNEGLETAHHALRSLK